ncbi:MAG: alpha/beta hydrolase [Acidimicrobiales bacterium]
MASPEAEATFELFRQLQQQMVGADPTLEEQRAGGEQFGAMTAPPPDVAFDPVDVDGIPGQWINPAGAADDRVILYLHGGGYRICSVNSHRAMIGHLATAAGCRSLAIDYRLAPEHPHPAQVEDAVTAYRWLLAAGFAPGRIALSGDSAGGGLCVLTLLALRADGIPMPAAAALMSPWVDLEAVGDTFESRGDVDLLIDAASSKAAAEDFLQGRDPRDPTAAPLHAELAGLPPVLIQVGDHEVLLADSVRLAERLQAAGVPTELTVFPEMQHVFQVCAGNMPEADGAVQDMGAYIRRQTT